MFNDRPEPAHSSILSRYWEIRVIGALLLTGTVASLVLEFSGLDLAASRSFFVQGGAHGGWALSRDQPWKFLYDYGEYPPVILALVCVWLYRAAQSGRFGPAYARPCLVVILTMALGPALLVNGILKKDWGRPRPADIAAFGGSSPYHKVWQLGQSGDGKSFTCGHCAAGYAMASVASFGAVHPIVTPIALVGGIAYGTLLGMARIVQGGHFLTDVIWSGVLMLALAAGIHGLVFRVPGVTQERSSPIASPAEPAPSVTDH